MKLLFDHNLPLLLVSRLADLFPQSQHVFALGLDRASDWQIRDYARKTDYFIVTKDADFSDLCVLLGYSSLHRSLLRRPREATRSRPLPVLMRSPN